MGDNIRVLIADDHPVFRKGLREIILAEPGLQLIAEVADGVSALAAIREQLPQVALLDVDMPHLDGIMVSRTVIEEGLSVAVVMLTMHRNERFFNAALDVGVHGYVLKDSRVSEIIGAIRAVSKGNRFVTPLLTDYLLNRRKAQTQPEAGTGLAQLTEAERRVLKLIAQRYTSQEIADKFFISIRTVNRHRANIASKFDLKGPHALLHFALEHKDDL
jgi:two-component system, NarL family, response regulator DegU